MNIFNIFIIGYLMGGLTLFPLLLALYVYLPNKPLHKIPYLDQLKKKLTIITATTTSPITTDPTTATTATTATNNKEKENNNNTATATTLYKVGWLRMTFGSPPIISLKKPDQRSYFTVLKQHTLFLYDSEEQYDCQLVLSLKDYKVSVYPEDVLDPELFSRPYWIQLKPLLANENQTYYFHCHVCIEKEDWYHIFLQASGQPKFPQPMSLEPLIQMIHSNSHHLEVQWFNALLSRLFMGIHLTKKFHQAIEKKIMAKVDKINARKPPFLGEIQVRNIDIGKQNGSIPFITQPKLLSVSPQGECWLEFMLDYHGNNCTIEIATVLQWSYSDRLPPLTMDIVLSVSLQSIQGKMKLLIKPPPSNRLWYGFEGLPKMKWNIVPLVWEKKIGHSMVVKAIIKHLEEVFSDTMVLPHMDDTTFFDNAGFGGIYQDDMILHHDNEQGESNMEDITTIDNNQRGDQSATDSSQLTKSHSSSTTTTAAATTPAAYIKNKNNKKGLFKTSPTSVSLSHLSSMDTQTSSLSTSSSSLLSPSASSETNNSIKKASTEPIPIQNNKKDQLTKKLPLPNKNKNNKKENLERKKMKQQDIKLLSTVKSLPELISAHTSQHQSSQQQQQQQHEEDDTSFFLSTSPSNHHHNDTSSSSSFISHSLSPPKLNESSSTTTKSMPVFLSTSSSSTTTTSSSSSLSSSSLATSIQPNDTEEKSNHDNDVLSTSPNAPLPPPKLITDKLEEDNNNTDQQQHPTLRARKSIAHLTQKTSASTAITQISPAVGVFLGKQLPTIKTTN
ncbi:putative integral membrane protein conserved region-domain-containing protein [Cunninghamella echinulata]|nr:putative integral membrane protein conserved region-domain-containing protein [Cunninghamella echinulata]